MQKIKIVSINYTTKIIPLKTPFITALRRVDEIELLRVSVGYNDGSISFGEAPATVAITGEGIDDIVSSIQRVEASLLGLEDSEALEVLHKSSIGNSAKSALDMAFVKRASDISYKDKTIQTDITISLNDVDMMFRDARDALSKGMSILKVKLGSDINHAIKVTNLLSSLDAKLIIDANQAWSLQDSLEFIDKTKETKLELIEQPVVASDLKSLKIITNYSSIPILADEAVFTLRDAKEIVASKSADMINVKLMKCGGVTKAREILEYARQMRVGCMLGSMLEGPISINSALHLAFEYSDVIKYVDLDSPLLYKELSNELEFKYNGCNIEHL